MSEPIRKIVLTRAHEPLGSAFATRSFGPAAPILRRVKVKGMEYDDRYHPVRVPGRPAYRLSPVASRGFNYEDLAEPKARAAYAVRAFFDSEDEVERLKADKKNEVVGVYADLRIAPTATYCGDDPVGTYKSVASRLGVITLRKLGLVGRNVRIAIVDTGIDGTQVPVDKNGWAPGNQNYVGGSTGPDHGTMCAFDALIAAPNAKILDFALLQSTSAGWNAFLSDGIAAFAELISIVEARPGPLVVNNSWGLFDRSEDEPVGSPGNYSANPNHPFSQMTASLVAAGADVCFAAGNCGAQCPDGRCGTGDTGPGASIHGANSHPDVITVAAVTVKHDRLGYSSQGPGGLAARKPDLAGYSHFSGSGIYDADGGTSAASPVVAGVIAALRQKTSVTAVPPPAMKALLQKTARKLVIAPWNRDTGYGVINGAAAAKEMKIPIAAAAAAATGPKAKTIAVAKVPIARTPIKKP